MMKKAILILLLIFPAICKSDILNTDTSYIIAQDSLNANNISSQIWNSGVFDQDLRVNNYPGFIWPKGSGHAAIFSAGFTISGYVNNQVRLAAASFRGEYRPGYCINGNFFTSNIFKIYKVTRGDNSITNPDWANWGLMIPYGAPFEDINNNGIYEPSIDKAGVKGSVQTIFLCMTDADPTTHSSSEGFGGGSLPLGTEVHLTAWCYDNPGYGDMQFLKWSVINKNNLSWDSVAYSIVSYVPLGDGQDNYIGCDSIRDLGFAYNADDQDGDGTRFTYGAHPPAVGFAFLNCNNSTLKTQSIDCYQGSSGSGYPICEQGPNTPHEAYLFLHGYKRDGSPWINPFTLTPTFYCYPGNPVNLPAASNWTEFGGSVRNCGGAAGQIVFINAPSERFLIMNSSNSLTQQMNPGDTEVVQIAQLIARGTNNLTSVTRLKELSDAAKTLCENNFIIGIHPISSEIPKTFSLSQNYPNPFNPTTKIKFDIKKSSFASIKIYDVIGKEISTLVNEQLQPGMYEIYFDGTNYPSGVYFYSLVVGDNTNSAVGFSNTKKMILIK